MEQIKIAMICHFSNPEVRSHLPLDNRKLYTFVRKMLRLPAQKGSFYDIAPWDTNMITEFQKREDIDLHVISAHTGMKRNVISFTLDNVHYSFLNCDMAVMLKYILRKPKIWLKFNPLINRVHKIIDNINPDLVLLVGAENAYISSAVLPLSKYPVCVLCQTIFNNPDRGKYGNVDPHNAYVERLIFGKYNHFGVYGKMHYELLRNINKDADIFYFGWPSQGDLLNPVDTVKEYDFVNFSLGMSDKKGYPDSIKALALVKKQYPNVRLNLVGKATDACMADLKALVDELGLSDNVTFTGFFDKQSDMFLHIQKSRFALLPCKMDIVSGTMNQAMQLNLPLVVYETTGTPSYNAEKRCVLIAKNNNIEDLAGKMMMLLSDDALSESLKVNAREYQEKKAAESVQNGKNLIEELNSIIRNSDSNER